MDVCKWKQDAFWDRWDSDCANSFEFNDGGPKDNGFAFCPYCGKHLEEVKE